MSAACICSHLRILLIEAAGEADHHGEDPDAHQHEPVLVVLYFVQQVHPEDSRHHGARGHNQGADLNEETELDDLVPDTVQVRGDELISVLDHIIEYLGLGHNVLQISEVSLEQLLYFFMIIRTPIRLGQVEIYEILKRNM